MVSYGHGLGLLKLTLNNLYEHVFAKMYSHEKRKRLHQELRMIKKVIGVVVAPAKGKAGLGSSFFVCGRLLYNKVRLIIVNWDVLFY